MMRESWRLTTYSPVDGLDLTCSLDRDVPPRRVRSAQRAEMVRPTPTKSKAGNGDAACGNDAALRSKRADASRPMRAQVGPWASVGFNLGHINPLGDLSLASPGTVDSPCGLARRVSLGMPPFTIGAVPSTYRVRTAPLSDEHDVSDERVEELRTALQAVGARSVDVSREVTFELDAQRGSDAMADVAELLFALSWPPAVTASIVR